jgi:hypothetical protein
MWQRGESPVDVANRSANTSGKSLKSRIIARVYHETASEFENEKNGESLTPPAAEIAFNASWRINPTASRK